MNFLVISGMSGSGKSHAIAVLEDMGYYCIDNMPPSLIPSFADLCVNSQDKMSRVAFVVDARGAKRMDKYLEGLKELKENGVEYKLLFLETSDDVLVARYKETRRLHPLVDSDNPSVEIAIQKERELLKPVRDAADFIIDTSRLSVSQFREHIVKVLKSKSGSGFIINVESFGFKFGIPKDSDLLFDVRCFPNPFYINELKNKTGLDKEVSDYVMSFDDTKKFVKKLDDMIHFLIPLYQKEGKTSLIISIGCTGGKHRSVTIAEHLNKFINENGYHSVVSHRDILKNV